MSIWAIHATVTSGGATKQIPTFYLDSWVQGTLTETAAERVARRIVDPAELADEVHVRAYFHEFVPSQELQQAGVTLADSQDDEALEVANRIREEAEVRDNDAAFNSRVQRELGVSARSTEIRPDEVPGHDHAGSMDEGRYHDDPPFQDQPDCPPLT